MLDNSTWNFNLQIELLVLDCNAWNHLTVYWVKNRW